MTHVPVMLSEVIAHLQPVHGERYIDGTFGAGGYTRAICAAADCQVLAIDRDPNVIAKTTISHAMQLHQGNFDDLDAIAAANNFTPVNGVVLDIGVSSMQIDNADRGFSFMQDGPLDMRMSQSGDSAADVVNNYSAADLADIIYKYGEERASRKIAAAIVLDRKTTPFTRTLQLAEMIARIIPRTSGTHPATKTFQALRIYVNDELGALERGLVAAETILADQGRLVVVTFHSLEDRIVKDFLRVRSGAVAGVSRHLPVANQNSAKPTFKLITKNAGAPSDAEISTNPRARSAKLRAAIRINTTRRSAA